MDICDHGVRVDHECCLCQPMTAPHEAFPLPWRVVRDYFNHSFVLVDADGNPIPFNDDLALIQYLVAAVNACREIPTAALEGRVFEGPWFIEDGDDAVELLDQYVYQLQKGPDHAE